MILLAALTVKDHIAKPYRTAPLLSQETSTSVPELRGLLLTDTDAAWIDWVSHAGDSLGAHDVPAIAIATRVGGVFTSSGALYAFNHSGYANPWLGIDWPAAFNSLRVACTTDPPSDLFVLQPGTSTAPGICADHLAAKSWCACRQGRRTQVIPWSWWRPGLLQGPTHLTGVSLASLPLPMPDQTGLPATATSPVPVFGRVRCK